MAFKDSCKYDCVEHCIQFSLQGVGSVLGKFPVMFINYQAKSLLWALFRVAQCLAGVHPLWLIPVQLGAFKMGKTSQVPP